MRCHEAALGPAEGLRMRRRASPQAQPATRALDAAAAGVSAGVESELVPGDRDRRLRAKEGCVP